jgi:hypothetical protein
MKPLDTGGRWPADEPLDATDLAILDEVRAAFGAADPMPADLPERISFWLALRDLEVEVARLTAEEDQPVLAARGAEQSRTITFDSDSLTIMIRVDSNSDGTARVDGWLAPPQPRGIEMKTPAGALTTRADAQGRFAFSSVPRGSAQLVVQPAGPEPTGHGPTGHGPAGHGPAGAGRSVVTPALIL